jgi:Secretory lipase
MNLRSLALLGAAALLASCASHGSSSGMLPQDSSDAARVSPQAASTRGKIESLKLSTTITTKQMTTGVINGVVTKITGAPKCDVKLYAIVYDTIGVKGEAANASAAFMVPGPTCGKGPFPLVGYSHGTNIAHNQLITDPKTSNPSWTAPDQDPITVAAIYAAHGYAVAATDYLGLGLSTYPFHPYLHVDSEATAVIDSMRAVRTAAKTLGVALQSGTGVFLAGHSQGGQVAVGTQRAIESGAYKGEFSVIVDTASSGPYALSRTFQDALRNQSQDAPLLAAYTLTGYQKIYGNLYTSPTQFFKNPYAKGIDTLLPVSSYAEANKLEGTTLPLKLTALLQPAFVKSFLNSPSSPARVAAAKNNLLSGWKPVGEIDLCGGDRDPEVEFKNAIEGQRYFEKVHANINGLLDVNQLIPTSVPIQDYHVTVALFCLTLERIYHMDPKTGL